MRNRKIYPTSDSIVHPQSIKTLQLVTADPDSDYVIQQKSTDDGDRERFTFYADDTPPPLDSYDDRPFVPDAYHQRTPAPPKSTDDFYTEVSRLRNVKESIITNLYNNGQISSMLLANHVNYEVSNPLVSIQLDASNYSKATAIWRVGW